MTPPWKTKTWNTPNILKWRYQYSRDHFCYMPFCQQTGSVSQLPESMGLTRVTQLLLAKVRLEHLLRSSELCLHANVTTKLPTEVLDIALHLTFNKNWIFILENEVDLLENQPTWYRKNYNLSQSKDNDSITFWFFGTLALSPWFIFRVVKFQLSSNKLTGCT